MVVFEDIFKKTHFPTIVCRFTEDYPLAYANPSARFQLNPYLTVDQIKDSEATYYLSDLFSFENQGYYIRMGEMLQTLGEFDLPSVRIVSSSGEKTTSLCANVFNLDGEAFVALFLMTNDVSAEFDRYGTMHLVYRAAYNEHNADAAINSVLALAGSAVHVSRVYIFEPSTPGYCRNSYEWCAPDIEPVIDSLQNLRNEDYNYDVIVSGGMYITDDIRDIPQVDFEILDAQGIKALAILPLIRAGQPIGYLGFDDCVNYRAWSSAEIQLLSDISNVIISLIDRRNASNTTALSYRTLQTISDNTGNLIYVSNYKTNEVIFVNNSLAHALGADVSELVGKTCWQTLQKDMTGPCDFCPLPKMLDDQGNVVNDTYSWEFQNTITGNWYIAKDSIVEWIDGTYVHIESAVDITAKKEQEEQLRYYASVDTMTGAYNREWGQKNLNATLAELRTDTTGKRISLCFLDIDELKRTNDVYGHQAGDELIIRTVEAMRSCIRKTDLICRWGGDEFIILMECDKTIAERLVLRAQNKLKELNENEARPFELAFSYGLIELDAESDTNLDTVIIAADKLMYENKSGKTL